MDFANLKTNVEKARTKAIEGSAEAGVDTGPLISMFLKLKAQPKDVGQRDRRSQDGRHRGQPTESACGCPGGA
jgi:hypothetical protein